MAFTALSIAVSLVFELLVRHKCDMYYKKPKIMHIFGLIWPIWLKLGRLTKHYSSMDMVVIATD